MRCRACNGRLGWEDGDEGQWVSCLACPEGRAKYEADKAAQKAAQEQCDKSKQALETHLNDWVHDHGPDKLVSN